MGALSVMQWGAAPGPVACRRLGPVLWPHVRAAKAIPGRFWLRVETPSPMGPSGGSPAFRLRGGPGDTAAAGVKTGTAISNARRRYPGIALVPQQPDLYTRGHRIVAAVFDVLPIDAVCSIDELAATSGSPAMSLRPSRTSSDTS